MYHYLLFLYTTLLISSSFKQKNLKPYKLHHTVYHFRFNKSKGRARRQLIQGELRAEVAEERHSRTGARHRLGRSPGWISGSGKQSVYNVPPVHPTWTVWVLQKLQYALCVRQEVPWSTFSAAAPKQMGEGKYTWCNNQVLKAVAFNIAFVWAGEKPPHQLKTLTDVLASARDRTHWGREQGISRTVSALCTQAPWH